MRTISKELNLIEYKNNINIVATLWEQWVNIKDTTHHFSFNDYCKEVHGFSYTRNAITIINEEKYLMFVLRYSQ